MDRLVALPRVGLALLIGAALALGGCTGDAPPPAAADEPPLTAVPQAYVGRAGDSDVFLAVVPRDDRVRVYACDGRDLANATVDQWFEGPFDGTGPVTLTGGRLSLTLRAADGGFAGELRLPDGRALPFTASLPADGSALYDAEVRAPNTGEVTRDGTVIALAGEHRGVIVPTRPRRCVSVSVTGANGELTFVVVCK